MDERCESTKAGRFGRLRCCMAAGHDGNCNFVVVGVMPAHNERSRPRRQSDAEYAKRRERYLLQKQSA